MFTIVTFIWFVYNCSYMKPDNVTVATRLTTSEVAVIQTEIRRGRAMSTSDFLRQAIREKIAKIEGEA